jgi:hypothetical protein
VVKVVLGLGVIIPPVKIGDTKGYASIKNTLNCVKYKSNRDDIVLITLKTGDRLHNQMLDVVVLDGDDNKLRQLADVTHDVNIIFSNMNGDDVSNEITLKRDREMFGLKDSNDRSNHVSKRAVEISDFYVCFNNIYTDKSWSFQPQTKEVELFVDIKNITTIKQYNYRTLGKYFNRLKFEHYDRSQETNQQINNLDQDSIKPKKLVPLKHVFSEKDWLNEINYLSTELNNIILSLKESESILTDLSQQEIILRDTNEEIFSNFTKTAITLYVVICVIGVLQLIYYRWLLKKKKILA